MLLGLGSVGLASAGAGLGTTAYFNDTESFAGNSLQAGSLDLFVDYESTYDSDGTVENQADTTAGTVDGEPAGMFYDLQDVKPGDTGSFDFCFRIDDNPSYMWACGDLTQSENGMTEPEMEVDTEDGGELAESIIATLSYCTKEGDTLGVIAEDVSLLDVFDTLKGGVPLDADTPVGFTTPGEQAPYSELVESEAGAAYITGPCLCVDWELPSSVGNEVQSDMLSFDLEFHAQQSRHNDGTTNPCIGDLVLLDNDEDSPGLVDNGPERTEPSIEWTLGTDSDTDALADNQMEVTFKNPSAAPMVFDYRIDGESGDDTQYTGQTISSGPLAGQDFGKKYNWVVVSGGSETVTLTAFDGIELGARVGAEQDWYIDWIRFDVV